MISDFIKLIALYAVNSVISGVSGLVRSIAKPVAKWTTETTESGDMLYQGSSKRSLVVVVIVTIQLLVTVSVARSVIFFLLLTSGDVEQNPGPCQTTGSYYLRCVCGPGEQWERGFLISPV